MARLLKTLAVTVPAFLMLGITNPPQPQFVAKASNLAPAPYVRPSMAPVVIEVQEGTPEAASVLEASPALTSDSGRSGYTLPGLNCVACVLAMTGRSQPGNAGSWSASHSVPHIGDIMIFRPGEQGASGAGHVGVVVGIHGNRISLAHCHWAGGQTEFYSTGKFF